ncbi:VanW family protein [Methylocapsa sp. S129]|uniref:VanW family protein n=1 Tax=Methylocapsa sp. S129 TaxID=1641869 RepID=UPI00131AC836|nr:VanW family protein [Methylocapsa sp. S129]
MISATQPHYPGLADALLFQARASGLRLRRWATALADRSFARPHRQSAHLIAAPAIAEARSPLWTAAAGPKDRALTAGKVHNLRLALRGIDGIEVPAGEIFSFWKQVGRPSRARGFVAGRELREGCMIASPGGGLCQLSNALYEAALRAGFEIVERHAHSRRVPGSRAALGRDATVFWNYVDLRLRATRAFRIEARLTSDALIVTFRAAAGSAGAASAPPHPTEAADAHDCVSCGESACRRNDPERAPDSGGPSAWLVDAGSPEFSALFARLARSTDALMLPTRRFASKRYDWPKGLCERENAATWATLRRSLALRNAGQGGALQARALEADARLAAAYAARLSHLDTHVVVAQNLLPHLWRLGVLQGRSFDVLMQRLPMDVLQARLDNAASRYPQSPTLADFRSPRQIVADESAALGAARTLYTAHPDIAACFSAKTVLLDWARARPMAARRGGKIVLFPASALARKGAYALREAMADLDLDLVIAGQAVETWDFWAGLRARILAPGERPQEIAAVVLPAIVEHQPRALLAALAAGIPVIATPACGLSERAGLTLVPAMNVDTLRAALKACCE